MADNGLTMCTRDPEGVTLAAEGDEPTCFNCSYEWGVQRDLKKLKEEQHPAAKELAAALDGAVLPQCEDKQ